jgi:hypothetical protein
MGPDPRRRRPRRPDTVDFLTGLSAVALILALLIIAKAVFS